MTRHLLRELDNRYTDPLSFSRFPVFLHYAGSVNAYGKVLNARTGPVAEPKRISDSADATLISTRQSTSVAVVRSALTTMPHGCSGSSTEKISAPGSACVAS